MELTLFEPRSIKRGLFRPEAIRRMFAQHRANLRDHGNRILGLLNFETWYRVLIEGDEVENAVPCGNSTNIVLT